jgi:hypothetical protein
MVDIGHFCTTEPVTSRSKEKSNGDKQMTLYQLIFIHKVNVSDNYSMTEQNLHRLWNHHAGFTTRNEIKEKWGFQKKKKRGTWNWQQYIDHDLTDVHDHRSNVRGFRELKLSRILTSFKKLNLSLPHLSWMSRNYTDNLTKIWASILSEEERVQHGPCVSKTLFCVWFEVLTAASVKM